MLYHIVIFLEYQYCSNALCCSHSTAISLLMLLNVGKSSICSIKIFNVVFTVTDNDRTYYRTAQSAHL